MVGRYERILVAAYPSENENAMQYTNACCLTGKLRVVAYHLEKKNQYTISMSVG